MQTSSVFRIQVVGTSGSGKSTLARRISEHLNIEHLELDSIYHQPNWTPLPEAELKKRVSLFSAKDQWVVDGNYSITREILNSRITHLIWLDYPRWFVMWRIVRRTLWRVISRRELWNGNRETAAGLLNRNSENNILLWAWTSHAKNRERYRLLFEELPGVLKIRIGSPFQVNRQLKALEN